MITVPGPFTLSVVCITTDAMPSISQTIAEMLASDFEPLQQKAGRFFNDTDEINSIISAAISQTRFLDSPQIVRDLSVANGVDFAQLRERPTTVYLVLPQNRLTTHANWLRLVIASALRALTNKPKISGRPNILFILDEFAQLGHLKTIEDCLANTRGFGITLWPILQDLLQLKHIYNDMWEVFLGTSGMINFFTPQTMFTAEYLSKRCGQQEIEKLSRNLGSGSSINPGNSGNGSNARGTNESSGLQWSPHTEPLHRPEQLFGLEQGKMICFKEYLQHPIYLDAPWYQQLPWCNELDANPYA